jgi:hypothetical protein
MKLIYLLFLEEEVEGANFPVSFFKVACDNKKKKEH